MKDYSIDTVCQLNDESIKDQWGALSYPIYQTATFAHPGLGESTGFDYTRMQNPTRQQLEYVVASLEHGTDALAFASGMAAITAVMELFSPGDHLIVDQDLYGGSVRLFNEITERTGSASQPVTSTGMITVPFSVRTQKQFILKLQRTL